MEILFVCRSNAGRSQIAEGIFNKLTKKNHAYSAGTMVKEEDRVGWPAGKKSVDAAKEAGVDIYSNKRKQVTPQMVDEADKVVVIMKEDEIQNYVPDYIKRSQKTEFWNLDDMREQDYAFHVKIMKEIEERVQKLVSEIE